MATFQVGPPQGMAKDINPTALPNEVFSHTENVRFEDALFSILTFPMQVIEKLLEAGKKLLSGDFAGAAKVIVDPILKLFKAISNAFMNFIRSIPVVGRLFKDENEKIEEDIDRVGSYQAVQYEFPFPEKEILQQRDKEMRRILRKHNHLCRSSEQR